MELTNLLDYRKEELLESKGVMYIETSSKSLPYKILKKVYVKEESIEYGFRYTFYKDSEGNLYSGFLTNSVEAWQEKDTGQMRMELF